MSVNSVVFSGNVGSDAEVRYTSNGKAIGQFNLAVSNGFGEHKTTMWLKCLILGDRANKLCEYIKKGNRLCVSGRLDVREWTGNDGTKQKSVEVIIADIEFMSGAAGGGNGGDNNQYRQPEPKQQFNQDPPMDFDDDIPFATFGLQYGKHRIYAL